MIGPGPDHGDNLDRLSYLLACQACRGRPIEPVMLTRLSPLGWDRINLTDNDVWSDRLDLDANGFMSLLIKPLP